MEPDRPCVFFYQIIATLATAIADVWRVMVPTFVRWCGAYNPCIIWCLCCNVWGCWLIAILIAIALTMILVTFILMAVLMLVICFIVCLIFVILSAPSRQQLPNCAAYEPVPPPPVNAPTGDGPTGKKPDEG
jgi:hypothetical protein